MSKPAERERADLFLLSIARQMRSEDFLHVGASQLEVWLAAEVARLLWAPGLQITAAGSFHLSASLITAPDLRSSRTYGRDVVAGREATLSQTRFFDDLSKGRLVFSGALQVDAFGNGNLIGFETGGTYVRGPGSAGLPSLTSYSDRFFFALPRHSRNVLVPKVHRISVLGDPLARAKLGLVKDAMREVITPLASFRSDGIRLRLASVSPGVAVEEIRRDTGFDVDLAADFSERSPATAEELGALRYVRGQTGKRHEG